MKNALLYTILLILISSCGRSQQVANQNYPNQVGDISFNKTLDDTAFKVCNRFFINQYYSYGIKLEKPAIVAHFQTLNNNKNFVGETGYITIRFVVNCEGRAGRFRVLEMDTEYRDKKFNEALINQLLQRIKDAGAWPLAQYQGHAVDYYFYLIFKVMDGEVKQILP